VIHLENFNEWNLSPAKEGSSKREREIEEKKKKKEKEQGLKSKRGKTSFEKLHVSKREKKKRMKLLGEILSKKKERRSHSPYSAKSDVWHQPYPHIICICTTFYSLTFPFLTPFLLHHSSSTMVICHTNSLEFSFAFTICKV
jgi:hypothetical protein